MEKQEIHEHGIEEDGTLVVRKTHRIIRDGKLFSEKSTEPYSPTDINNMEGFDGRSIVIANAIKNIEAETPTITGKGIEEVVTYDRKTEGDNVNVRQITRVFEDGVEIGKRYTDRQIYHPGRDVSGCDAISKAVARAIHTPEVIAAYKK